MFERTPKLSNDLPNLAIHGSHNAALVLEYQGKILEIIEFERFFNVKNVGFCQYFACNSRKYAPELLLNYIKEKYGFTEFGTVLHQHCYANDDMYTNDITLHKYYEKFPAREYVEMKHHASHAAGTFYQSPFEKATCISFDGGGNDGFFNIYYAERDIGVRLIKTVDIDLGFAYMSFGEVLHDIRREPNLSIGNLVYAGKILGYQSYGKVRDEWYEHVLNYYRAKPDGNNYRELLIELGKSIDINFEKDRISGQQASDLAATSQKVFEHLFFEYAHPYIDGNDFPICITGGCGLNIVLNTKVKETYDRPVFVGPAPNDSGIATGMMLSCLKPKTQYDVSYLGIDITDKWLLPRLIEDRKGKQVSLDCIVEDLYNDKIIGVVQGRSEHGPRALGNRSIICSPLPMNMKDTLNRNVKNREWYRPFAPIVREQDVSEYFEWEGPSEFMSFSPKVREKYLNIIPSVTHFDGTARVQTVTREKNPFMYDLLTLFQQRTGVGVLINTSFNVDKKPIVSSYTDAFRVFDETQLDCLYLNGYYFTK